ncbi:MAG: DUF4325 domain-containing protein [Deltaproteobacteria bacterium]|nr:DUF4325 domain-containing protein [Deltaproteobacteria bacterium]
MVRELRISRQAIHRHLILLVREGKIIKLGTSRKTAFYVLNQQAVLKKTGGPRPHFRKRYKPQGLDEESVFEELLHQPTLLKDLSPKVRSLFHYAFTEILNNAIDHAQSPIIVVDVQSTPHDIRFAVIDHGVGIFENIRSKKMLANEMEALQDLLKGKQTTAPGEHSGEGIFFTSKIADRLTIESHRKRLLIDHRLDDLFVEDIRKCRGTRVRFMLSKQTSKDLDAIFAQYTNEEFQFSKSQVTVKLFKEGEEYISRSQAKRLLHGLDRFTEITVDFKGITSIGQGFADEVFRVFPNHHPGMTITPINCHENVEFMIKRAKASP